MLNAIPHVIQATWSSLNLPALQLPRMSGLLQAHPTPLLPFGLSSPSLLVSSEQKQRAGVLDARLERARICRVLVAPVPCRSGDLIAYKLAL
jgi:hypothetical protein